MKNKETLEEAAERTEFERYGKTLTNYTKQRPAYNLGFQQGAKWQKEQDKKLYSEEDMRKMYDFGSIGHFTENESLEQFKNK